MYFYDKPCYILTQDGFRSFTTISELKTNIEKLFEFYETHEFRSAQLRNLQIYSQTPWFASALCQWALLDKNKEEIVCFETMYWLRIKNNTWKISAVAAINELEAFQKKIAAETRRIVNCSY